jgi:hypothetical protein
MKKQVVSFTLLLITIGFMSTVASVHAQTSYGVKATVPFDFMVGDRQFRAGAITARRLSTCDSVLVISSLDNRQHHIRSTINVQSSQRSDNARLVFRKYGTRYYLAQVWTSGDSGREFSKSPGERALERETRRVAKNVRGPEMVTVVAVVAGVE